MSDAGATPPPPPPTGGYGGGPGYGAPGYGGVPASQPPPNYLVWAILSTLFCCLPLGVASIVFSAQVNSKWAMGDAAGAAESSRKAKSFALWGTIVGAVIWLLVIAFYVVIIVVAVNSSSSSSTFDY